MGKVRDTGIQNRFVVLHGQEILACDSGFLTRRQLAQLSASIYLFDHGVIHS
jgi:hypothetical protein